MQLQLDPIAMNLVQLERWCARSYGSAVRRLVRRCGGSSSCAAAHAASYSRAAIRSAVRRSLVNLVQLERWCARSCGGEVWQLVRQCGGSSSCAEARAAGRRCCGSGAGSDDSDDGDKGDGSGDDSGNDGDVSCDGDDGCDGDDSDDDGGQLPPVARTRSLATRSDCPPCRGRTLWWRRCGPW